LVLATGTRARKLPDLPDHLDNLVYLRNTEDALRLRAGLAAAPTVTVLGGGFIGLEIAATAGHLGKPVQVFEAAPRLMARAVSPEASEHVAATLREAGVVVHLGACVQGIEHDAQRVVAVQVDGERFPVDLLVAGIGAVPETA